MGPEKMAPCRQEDSKGRGRRRQQWKNRAFSLESCVPCVLQGKHESLENFRQESKQAKKKDTGERAVAHPILFLCARGALPAVLPSFKSDSESQATGCHLAMHGDRL